MAQSKMMSDFAKLMMDMTKWLDDDPKLDIVDQLLIENHMQVLHMAYARWKKEHAPPERSGRDRSVKSGDRG